MPQINRSSKLRRASFLLPCVFLVLLLLPPGPVQASLGGPAITDVWIDGEHLLIQFVEFVELTCLPDALIISSSAEVGLAAEIGPTDDGKLRVQLPTAAPPQYTIELPAASFAGFKKDHYLSIRNYEKDMLEVRAYEGRDKQLAAYFFKGGELYRSQRVSYNERNRVTGTTITDQTGKISEVIFDNPVFGADPILPEADIQSLHPEIVELAERLTKYRASDQDKVLAVFNWVKNNISYDYSFGPEQDALSVLATRQGTCIGYTNLTAALLRSVGIPTTYTLGCVTKGCTEAQHIWNMALIEGEWYELDATWGVERVSDGNVRSGMTVDGWGTRKVMFPSVSQGVGVVVCYGGVY